jgi:spore coat polysaccharide biosynthesis protein SpsF
MIKERKVVAIVQARMGSTRLPNKMMLSLHGYPICEWVYRRVLESKKINNVIFSLPDTKENDVLEWYLKSIGSSVFRGSENNLVDRYLRSARLLKADVVVRVCADNPFVSASEIDKLVDFFLSNKCDYAYNHIPKENNYPDGIGAEICSIRTLEDINQRKISVQEKEHVFNYIWNNPSQYIIKTFEPIEGLSAPKLKLDIDTMDDYLMLLEKKYEIKMSAAEIIKVALNRR